MSDNYDTSRAPEISGARDVNDNAPQLGGDAALKHVVELMRSEDEEIRQQAVDKLEALGTDRAFELLLAALDDPNRQVVNRAVEALGYLGDPRALDKLIELFYVDIEVESEALISPPRRIERYIRTVPRANLMRIVEAIGRIGHPQGLVILAPEPLKRVSSHDFHFDIRVSWAIANIGTHATEIVDKQQAVRRFISLFPAYEFANKYIINRLPWDRQDMLDTAASLLTEPEIAHDAACFLAYFGDARGRDVLLTAFEDDRELTEDLSIIKGSALHGLINSGEREVIPILINLLDAPFPPTYAIRALDDALSIWGDNLTTVERKRLTSSVPYLINYLKLEGYIPDVVRGINRIRTELADDLLNEWIAGEVYRMFESFIERGDASGVPDDVYELALISRCFNNGRDPLILNHPLMRQYAFPAMRARYVWLRAQDPPQDPSWLVACIGWLGDPQALSWLLEEFERVEQAELASPPEEYHHNYAGEFIYAIANLQVPEGIPFLINRLLNQESNEWYEVNKALRFYINDVPDERVVLAQLAINTPESDWADTEVIEAIGRTGLACAVPGLARLLERRDDGCSEAINALAEIAKRNAQNTELVNEIVSHLIPMLRVRTRVRMNFFFQPLETMRINAFTALVLKDIGTPEALAAVERWKNGELYE